MDFKEKYSRDSYLEFFRNDFLPDDFAVENENISIDFTPNHIEMVTLIGKVDSLELKIYEVKHNSENDPRVSLSKDVFRIMRDYSTKYALILFISDNSTNYRFSLATISFNIEDKKVTREYSNPKRFSFFLGKDSKTHTPEEFLIKKGKVKDFKDLLNRFSVEVVNKEFYNKIALLFTQLVGGERRIGNKNIILKPSLKLPSTNDHQKMQEFGVRLIGRLVFCWFLKKKKSKNSIPLIPENILSSQAITNNKNYYHNVLEKLFFMVLNTPMKEREKFNDFKNYENIPFLNGGLFEPHFDDYFIPSLINTLIVPDKWLTSFIETLEGYNFTIDENTSIDIELSVDPEMLGRIFENLLAEINPETGETVRKSTGSYYTPRTIVEYMVDESLKAFLHTKTQINEKKLSSLLSFYQSEIELTENERKTIMDALDNAKILDPACGSGAFPIGILQKMLLILQKIDPDSNLWFEKMLSSIEDAVLKKDIKQKYDKNNLNFIRKFGLIQKCIYGIDKQTIAVEISKLRCFLTLIVDEEPDDHKDNRGIIPLPNLEFKFVAANTLMKLDDDTLFEEIEQTNRLEHLRAEYFTSSGKNKKSIENEFSSIQEKITRQLAQNRIKEGRAFQLANWEPFSNNTSSWFDSELMFGVSEGFDIVIGNPPYGILNKKQNKSESIVVTDSELEYYKKSDFYLPAVGGMLNIFRLFILMSIRLLSKDGVFIEIFPLAFIADASIKNLRGFILSNNQIISIDAFPERDNINKRVFEAAKMSVCILNLIKAKGNKPFFIRINEDKFINELSEKNYLSIDTIKLLDSENMTFPLTSTKETALLVKIYQKATKFKTIGKCNTGEIDMTFCKDAFSNDKRNAVLLKGAIIDRYLLRTKMSQGEIVFIDEKILNNIKKINTNLKKQERIVLQGISGVNEKIRLKMMIIKNAYCANSLNYLTVKNDLHIKFMLALFNGKLLNFIFSKFSTNSNVNNYEIDNLPIVIPHDQSIFISLVDKILTKKSRNEDTIEIENKIDFMIYKLYKLTFEEATIVEPNLENIIKITEYNNLTIF